MKIHPYTAKASELKSRHSDNQRQLVYFQFHILTATALLLKFPLYTTKALLSQADVLTLHCH